MSKQLSFRARALDASKLMPVYKADEIPELPDFAAINRAVPQMPTGMEKEEETEHHLQRALSAQQVYGTSERLFIPIPKIEQVTERYNRLYKTAVDYKPPKQFIHVQPWGMDQEIPDYDMDSEDEQWLTKQSKNFKNLNLTHLKFENMMDRLEKGSGQTVVTLHEAKALLKEDDDLTIAVYDYWLNKRLRLEHALIPQVKTEKRDGSTTNNPYVAFRRRTEKMQTRKNRKNDETSYEKMLKLRRDLNKALTILELMKRREKSKKELLKLTIEIVEKRHQVGDWDGKSLAEALAQRHKIPSLIPLQSQLLNRDWGHKEEGFVRKKREYKKRKHKHAIQAQQNLAASRPTLPHYSEEVLQPEAAYSSEEEGLSPQLSASDHETEEDPDGAYAFRRKAGCFYHAPINDGLGNWPWCGREDGGFGDKRFRYSLTSISEPRQCVGFARRRVGRGGRVILDRGLTEWDDYLSELDLPSCPSEEGSSGWVSEYNQHIREAGIPHFRPQTPPEDGSSTFGDRGGFGPGSLHPAFRDSLSPPISVEFNIESFQDHREQLLQMQRQQQEQLLKQETDLDNTSSFQTICVDPSFSTQPTSRFTLDSARAQFAASAVCSSTRDLLKTKATTSDSSVAVTAASIETSTTVTATVTATAPPTPVLPLHSPALTALMQQPIPSPQPPQPQQQQQQPSGGGVKAVTPSTPVTVPSTLLPSRVSLDLTNGPVSSKTCGLSTSPAANILQLNYPIPSAASGSATPSTATVTQPLIITTANTPSSTTTTTVLAHSSSTSSSISSPVVSLTNHPHPATVLSGQIRQATLTTSKSLGTLSLSLAPRFTQTKSVTSTVVTKSPAPAVLRLTSSTPNSRNDNLSRENHEGVNNIVKDKIVAMEVT